MTNAKRLRALRLADSMNNSTVRVFVKYEKSRDELEAENAKLRKLVRELLPCYQWSDCYGGCMAADGPLCPRPARLTERARELGVEVPE